MAKVKVTFFCQNCGQQHSQWQGQCDNCKQWNTIIEEVVQKTRKGASNYGVTSQKAIPIKLSEVSTQKEDRISTQNTELDRVLGGGIIPGSVILTGGEPGIGKSTLLLQMALNLPSNVLYVSGEESVKQIKSRAERIQNQNPNCYIYTETEVHTIVQKILELMPEVVIIDSIQTLHSSHIESSPGSISQIRETASELIKLAKNSNIPIFLIGHINKDGHIAGPKILEHMVDVVLQFEGDHNHVFRILRGHKNRYGNTHEIGIYEMTAAGLETVENPSEILLSQSQESLSGSAIACTLEGIRPLMVEVQALVSTAVYGTPQRSTTGFNAKRLNMLLAVLEKRAGFNLAGQDVFLNLTGGIHIQDTSLDLAVLAAILSSVADVSLPKKVCFAAEVGLNGEIRPIPRIEQRIMEAEKLGFDTIYISPNNKITPQDFSIQIKYISKAENLKNILL